MAATQLFKYRLLVGQHIENIPGTQIEVTYNAGDTFESASRLEKFNSPGHSPKFERLQDDVKVGVKSTPKVSNDLPPNLVEEGSDGDSVDALDSMTVAELYKFARENDIPIGNARKKHELIEAIRKAASTD